MALAPLVRLNGRLYTRNSVTLRFLGVDVLKGIDSLDWSDEKPYELVSQVNQGGPPAGKAEGIYKCDASLGLYVDEGDLWEKALMIIAAASLGGNDITKANFPLSLTYREDFRTRVVVLSDVNVVGQSSGVSNDGKALVTNYKLQPKVIVAGGAALCNLFPMPF